MDDLISRREAIEAVEHITSSMSVCVNTDECHGMKRMQRQAVIELANLPSAQPEIVRCKDCKFIGTDATCCLVCNREGMGLRPFHVYHDDFCSYGERKDGRSNQQTGCNRTTGNDARPMR